MIRRHILLLLILITAAAILFQIFSRVDRPSPLQPHDMRTWQRADVQIGYPAGPSELIPPFDPRFIRPLAFDVVALPIIEHTTHALGAKNGANTYNVQPAGEMNRTRGGRHAGDDLNGIGGMNTDLGDPVFAIADGTVLFSANGSPGWGNIVILGHRTADGQFLQSFYAHLDKRLTSYGSRIPRGGIIGTVGDAGRRYPAHLHLELREMPTINTQMRGYYDGELPKIYRSPEKFVDNSRPSILHAPVASKILQQSRQKARENAELRYILPQ